MSTNQLRAVTSGEQQTKAPTIFSYLQDNTKFEKSIAAVAGQFFTADRFLRLAVNAVKKTPNLLQCDPQSVLGAFMASAALGLEPNTVQQQAFLIPYKKRAKVNGQWVDTYDCQFQIGYRGFVTLAHRSEHILSLEAETIHENDHFKHMKGSDAFLEYQKKLQDRGDAIGAYCFTKLASGIEMATVLPLDEILKIRGRSETYNALVRKLEKAESQKDRDYAERTLAETPWVLWFDDMAAKSAIKKHSKQLPLMPGDMMSAAANLDSVADANVVDMAAMADPDVVRGVVQDGYEPPALENDPAEEANFTPRQAQEAEPIEVRSETAKTTNRRAPQAQPTPAAQSAASGGRTYADVHQAMKAARTIDALDLAADLMRDVEGDNDRADLETLYAQRREELSRSTGMSME